MIVSESAFYKEIFNECLHRTVRATNVWELKIRAGEMPATSGFRLAKQTLEHLNTLHPNVLAARLENSIEELDVVYHEVEDAFYKNYGWLRAQTLLPAKQS